MSRNDTGVYVKLEFPRTDGSYLSIDVQVLNVSPETCVYYAYDFRFANGGYATVGLQQFGINRKVANYWIFDGAALQGWGDQCGLDKEGAMNCNIPYDWQFHRTYRYHIELISEEPNGDLWWGAQSCPQGARLIYHEPP